MIESFEIDRATWLHGEGGYKSTLLRGDGKMCCLGFLALACGVPEEQAKRTRTLLGLIPEVRSFLPSLFAHPQMEGRHMYLTNDLMNANDVMGLPDDVREERIADKFKEAGIKVTFTGSY